MPTVLRTIAEARATLGAWRKAHPDARLALVPTMGALHGGHLSLVELAHRHADAVVASVFVNPLQFGPGEDFERYPRTFDADLAALDGAGVDYVFAPAVDDMYPGGATETRISGGAAAAVLDGAHRPGHFDGVLTVVAKLLNIALPDAAVFGRKDAQQLFVIEQMVRDLNLPVEIVGAPISRDPDGLARSSRNVYLSADERDAALALPRALRAADAAAARGADVAGVVAAARAVITAEERIAADYVEAVDPATFTPPAPGYAGKVLVLIAARVGSTRLIDNATVMVEGGRE
ncbi:pantothenate synthetase [Pseudoclavibacter endophyticus]|uniref:Pantothenate synthetase n=1 Tax=Pseudoclavibacter endophyticus TaxID=1778590 RepID=A0A6H9WLC0_9MICO|nr:pantoate--beta-alanine ligase [Pseudoclavibacter endophyticus]KAB1648312.1 pantoate--beta-alanine ligase [Pseudoclavibacter endophyticus]GGA71579.1 pantothenate synthetase [Pseudoclavibacter endophyticus]